MAPSSCAWVGLPRFATVGQADVAAVLRLSAVPLLLSLVMVDFCDTLGTASAVAEEAGLRDETGGIQLGDELRWNPPRGWPGSYHPPRRRRRSSPLDF